MLLFEFSQRGLLCNCVRVHVSHGNEGHVGDVSTVHYHGQSICVGEHERARECVGCREKHTAYDPVFDISPAGLINICENPVYCRGGREAGQAALITHLLLG